MGNLKIPCEPRPEDLTALVDTREQLPLSLTPMKTMAATLDTGDYSLRFLESTVRVERKSLPDLVQCVGRERDRFEREVVRLCGFPVSLLIVEATWEQIEAGDWRGDVKPAAVIGSLLSWQVQGLAVHCCGNHERAGLHVSRFLFMCARRRWREARGLIIGAGFGSEAGAV